MQEIKDPETLKAEAIQSFALLQRTLREAEFISLDAEAQENTVKEAGRLLRNRYVEMTVKRQIVEFLKNLDVSSKITESTRQQVAHELQNWHNPL